MQTAIISANRTENGEAVYLTSCDAWTPDLALAEALEPEDFDWRLAFANRLREVSNAALHQVQLDANGLPHAPRLTA
ncbi:MAG: DUF2849 domain-containing protein [Rhodobacteraceae bacterium]|nr:DUF2849 domain-containing protein [Paracoccaceae bacterium]